VSFFRGSGCGRIFLCAATTHSPPPLALRGERGSAAEGIHFFSAAMIASNYRRYADALIAQMELDFSGTVGADEKQRSAWWAWLMQAGVPQAAQKAERPAWWVALKRAALALSRAVKAACCGLF